jgi:hypothetical protein
LAGFVHDCAIWPVYPEPAFCFQGISGMRAFRLQDQAEADLVGLGLRILLLAPEGDETLALQLAGFGGRVERETELYAALAAVIDDPADWDVLVLACDSYGGIEAGRRAQAMLGVAAERVSVILTSRDCGQQDFPEDRHAPILLRAPASAVSLRVGLEHALRGRLVWRL